MALRQEELTSLCDDVDLDRDRALVERCQAGDTAAFGNLYARYYERLLRFCLRRLNDRHEAEDAAQEAFARAWKALPRFAGERRFYPWLTVIAGNICTDMLRRRSRSTPTDDMELTAQHPVGVVAEDTSEELVLAAVDGELVNRALDRLSTRHRHVLAMREGSGWTYQQIADHEGVEIGTIETLLWRARQALKREFAVVSESKEALAGFLVATGALFRRSLFRMAHRGASMQQQSATAGGFRDAVAGVAVTGAAVAAAITAPIAFLSGPTSPAPTAGPAAAAVADPPLLVGGAATAAGAATQRSGASGFNGTAGTAGALGGSGAGSGSGGGVLGVPGTPGVDTVGGGTGGSLSGGLNQTAGGLNEVAGGVSTTVGGITGTVGGAVGGVTGIGATGGTNAGSGSSGLGGVTNGATSGASNAASGAVSGLSNTISGLLGGASSGLSGTSSSTSSPSPTTTTTTSPLGGVLGGLGTGVHGLLGG